MESVKEYLPFLIPIIIFEATLYCNAICLKLIFVVEINSIISETIRSAH